MNQTRNLKEQGTDTMPSLQKKRFADGLVNQQPHPGNS